jgi:hypothetical protein
LFSATLLGVLAVYLLFVLAGTPPIAHADEAPPAGGAGDPVDAVSDAVLAAIMKYPTGSGPADLSAGYYPVADAEALLASAPTSDPAAEIAGEFARVRSQVGAVPDLTQLGDTGAFEDDTGSFNWIINRGSDDLFLDPEPRDNSQTTADYANAASMSDLRWIRTPDLGAKGMPHTGWYCAQDVPWSECISADSAVGDPANFSASSAYRHDKKQFSFNTDGKPGWFLTWAPLGTSSTTPAGIDAAYWDLDQAWTLAPDGGSFPYAPVRVASYDGRDVGRADDSAARGKLEKVVLDQVLADGYFHDVPLRWTDHAPSGLGTWVAGQPEGQHDNGSGRNHTLDSVSGYVIRTDNEMRRAVRVDVRQATQVDEESTPANNRRAITLPSDSDLAGGARALLADEANLPLRQWLNHHLAPTDPAYPDPLPAPPSDADLLAKYAPVMNYDSQENYFADSPASLTNSQFDGTAETTHSNKLLDQDGNEIADSYTPAGGTDPLPYIRLSLTFLRGEAANYTTFPDPTPVSANDRIDAYGSGEHQYAPDAQRMHADPNIGDRIYGRAVQDGGRTWLQYWFFYYADEVPGFTGSVGDHEGDWEMIQIGLDDAKAPEVVTFAAHKDPEAISCRWNQIDKSTISDTPVPNVFVALGTHASYPFAGLWRRDNRRPDDNTNGEQTVRPIMVAGEFDGEGVGADWTRWPGFWGNSFVNGFPDLLSDDESDSPNGPRFQHGNRWTAPATFDANARPCSSVDHVVIVNTAAAASASGSQHGHLGPRVSAHLVDPRHVRVTYRFRTLSTPHGRISTILVTGHSSSPSAQPRTYQYSVRGRYGTITQDLPLGPAPFIVEVTGWTSRGAMVAKTSVPVKR